MSVPVGDRTESKFEVIVYVNTLHDALRELMIRNFGIRNRDKILRNMRVTPYVYSNFDYILLNHKTELERLATALTNDLRAANTIYPVFLHEYEKRRDYQNSAIVDCELILKELQRVVDDFDLDVNLYPRYVKLIDKEIYLIKKWRQKDNQMKCKIMGNI